MIRREWFALYAAGSPGFDGQSHQPRHAQPAERLHQVVHSLSCAPTYLWPLLQQNAPEIAAIGCMNVQQPAGSGAHEQMSFTVVAYSLLESCILMVGAIRPGLTAHNHAVHGLVRPKLFQLHEIACDSALLSGNGEPLMKLLEQALRASLQACSAANLRRERLHRS